MATAIDSASLSLVLYGRIRQHPRSGRVVYPERCQSNRVTKHGCRRTWEYQRRVHVCTMFFARYYIRVARSGHWSGCFNTYDHNGCDRPDTRTGRWMLPFATSELSRCAVISSASKRAMEPPSPVISVVTSMSMKPGAATGPFASIMFRGTINLAEGEPVPATRPPGRISTSSCDPFCVLSRASALASTPKTGINAFSEKRETCGRLREIAFGGTSSEC
jgi:hypothetical protein